MLHLEELVSDKFWRQCRVLARSSEKGGSNNVYKHTEPVPYCMYCTACTDVTQPG